MTAYLAADTVHVVFAHFRSIMIQAEDDRLITYNPARRIDLPKKKKRRVVPFSEDEISKLLDLAGDDWRGLLAFAVGSGLRSAELRAVTSSPDSLDWLGRQVHVHKQWNQVHEVVVPRTKTAAGVRTVPLADWVLEELAAHCARQKVEPGQMLFITSSGKPPRSGQLSLLMRRTTTKAGIVRPDGEAIRFHDCRHTFASILIRANLNPKQIQTYLGHASISETFDTYGHLFPSDDEAARDALNLVATRTHGT